MLSIIVLNYNRLKYTTQTVENLVDKTTIEHEFIFVDNGSLDGTREYLKSLENKTNAKKVTYVFNNKNLGVAGGRNSGLARATGNYLMTIDDDILVPDDYDKLFKLACDKIPNLGITGVNVESKKFKIEEFNDVPMQVKSNGNLGGGCLCLPRRTFETIGYFRADYIYGGEDCDMYNRVYRAQLLSAYIPPSGKHIDKRENEAYVELKRKAHLEKSKEYITMANNAYRYKRKKAPLYIPYQEPKVDSANYDKVILDGYK